MLPKAPLVPRADCGYLVAAMSRCCFSRTLLVILLALALGLVAGCRGRETRLRAPALLRGEPPISRFGPDGVDTATQTAYPLREDAIRLTDSGEQLYVFSGHTGEPMTGRQVAQAMRQADVVILGEMHTDPMAHRLQHRFVREALSRGSGALSIEMMTRDEQAMLARAQNNPGVAEQVLAETSLRGWPRWNQFYLPAIQAAMAMDRPVIASNAPRKYVREGRIYGYDYLRSLDRNEQQLFDLPEPQDDFPDYRQRVQAVVMAHPTTQPATIPSTQPTTRPERERMNAHAPFERQQQRATTGPQTRRAGPASQPTRAGTRPATRPTFRERAPGDPQAFYESQLVWDATMAQSILAARRHGTPVVHLVGSFHSDYDGGLASMLELRGQDVLTVSFVPEDSQRLRPEDVGRADIVIYTGANRPLPPEKPVTTRPAGRVSPAATQPARQPVRRTPTTAPATRPAASPTTRPGIRS